MCVSKSFSTEKDTKGIIVSIINILIDEKYFSTMYVRIRKKCTKC